MKKIKNNKQENEIVESEKYKGIDNLNDEFDDDFEKEFADGFDDDLEQRLEDVRKAREEENRKLSQMTEEEMIEYLTQSYRQVYEDARKLGVPIITMGDDGKYHEIRDYCDYESMKLLLCSDFKNVGYKYLDRFFDLSKNYTCLFVNYASDDYGNPEAEISSSMARLQELNFDTIELNENFDFSTQIDLIFVRGGNTTKLIHLLKKNNQFEKIKELAESGEVVYVGESAGTVLVGSDTEWTLRTEPYEYDLKELYGEDALLGFGFIDKMIFVHCSRYGFPFGRKIDDTSELVRVSNYFYKGYLEERKLYDPSTYITLGNNEVYYINGQTRKILKYDWSKIPVVKE